MARDRSDFWRSTVLTLLISAWFATVTAGLATRVVIGGWPDWSTESLLWLVAFGAPPVVLVRICRGAPPPIIAEVLYETEQSAAVARPGSQRARSLDVAGG